MPARFESAYGGTTAAIVGSLAIATVPLFGHTEGRTIIPQAFSALAILLAGLRVVVKLPRIHLAVFAFALLLVFWGITLLDFPEVWESFQSLLRMSVLAFAAHIIFRTPKQLMLLLGVYSATGAVNVTLNWNELYTLGTALSGGEKFSDAERFAGTFGNANTAGIYGTTTLLLAFIFLFSSTGWIRWLVFLSGGLGGVAVLYFTGSRKAMLALGLTALFVPWMASQRSKSSSIKWVKWSFVTIAMLTACTLLLSRLPYTERLVAHLSEGAYADSSSQERMYMLVEAVALWKQRPLFGQGFEGFRRVSGFDTYSHSTFSEVLCNGGIFGAALLGLFYVLPAIQLARLIFSSGPDQRGPLPIGLLGLWAQFVLFSAFAVMWDNADNLCLSMAVCGYLCENRLAKPSGALPDSFSWSPALLSTESAQDQAS